MDWAFFVVMFAFLLLASVAIIRAPLYLQRPLAFTLFCVGFLIGTYLFVPVPGLEWFAPFFFLKLLVSHLVKEAPFSSAAASLSAGVDVAFATADPSASSQ